MNPARSILQQSPDAIPVVNGGTISANQHIPPTITTTELLQKPGNILITEGLILPSYIIPTIRCNGREQAEMLTTYLFYQET